MTKMTTTLVHEKKFKKVVQTFENRNAGVISLHHQTETSFLRHS